ncbi:Ger(x)C family spore germination protein [Metabacillus halosaccharovorans]|uniref:Ger(x)C family spore germination protein n=1 Tax=Metabacillus halosaccharovorans TaxID=930124 RepID=UPI001C1FE1C4|nr:Ger(x)C family spore germination protein [Metabacillus halosaccharovorans]MBU7592567.1 Ger(x)C family spore germination protein [Metabacillus halosaccharovorans]
MIGKILLCLGTLFILTGCWDKKELEQISYVVAIGLDKSEDNKIEVTYQIANPEVGTSLTGSPPPGEKPYENVTILANDFLTARNTVNSFISRKLSFSQTHVLIVSEELARSEEFIKMIYTGIRERELRKTVNMIITKEKARQFINNNQPLLETRPHKYYQLMINRARETGFVPPSDLLQFFQTTERDADLFLAMYATTEKSDVETRNKFEDEYNAGQVPIIGEQITQFMGSALFKEGKMIGTLNGEETRVALIMDPTVTIEDMLTTYEDPLQPKYRIATKVTDARGLKVKMKLDKPHSKIRVEIPLSLEVIGVFSQINYSTDLKKQKLLKKHLEYILSKKANENIDNLQQKYGAEAYNWSLIAQRHFLTQKDYEEFDWMKSYPSFDIEAKVNVTIEEFGQQVQTPRLDMVED